MADARAGLSSCRPSRDVRADHREPLTPGSGTRPTLDYDANGNLTSALIQDGRPRTVNYITTASGQILSRIVSSAAASNPEEYYYYFNGEQVGEIGNDGASQTDYAQAIAARSVAQGSGAFAGGATSGTAYAAFGDAYAPTGPTSQGSATQSNSSYTVQSGDTLSSIAQSLWGDSSLWYLIADANGLSGGGSLTVGSTLVIPTKITDIHNNAATFTVYDPSKALGNVLPIAAPPPAHGNGCGILGEIIAVVVAIALQFIPGVGQIVDSIAEAVVDPIQHFEQRGGYRHRSGN